MGANVVAALFHAFDYFRIILSDETIEEDRRRQFQVVEHLEDTPDADAKAVVPPGEIALGLRRVLALIWIGAAPRQEGKMLDVQFDVESKPLAFGPIVVRQSLDRGIPVAAVAGSCNVGISYDCVAAAVRSTGRVAR